MVMRLLPTLLVLWIIQAAAALPLPQGVPSQSFPLPDEENKALQQDSSNNGQSKVKATNQADDNLKYWIGGTGLVAGGAAVGVAGTIWWTGRWTEEKNQLCMTAYVSLADSISNLLQPP